MKLETICDREHTEASRHAIWRSSPPKTRCEATDWARHKSSHTRRPFRKMWTVPTTGKAHATEHTANTSRLMLIAMVGTIARLMTSSALDNCMDTCCAQWINWTRAAAAALSRSSTSGTSRGGCAGASHPDADAVLSEAASSSPSTCVRTATKLFHSADSILPNSSRCQSSVDSSSSSDGVGMSTARRHCGGFLQTPSTAICLADSKVQASTMMSAGFSFEGKSKLRTAMKYAFRALTGPA
mmetsp:Transcript_36134/g.93230  ORF Transcript_36134/g.93230 Transcript_36134/m.93230 type:complete len:241 (+) Transcript_36134:807-1529(+)